MPATAISPRNSRGNPQSFFPSRRVPRLESLESRYALTAEATLEVEPCLAESTDIAYEQHAITTGQTTGADTSTCDDVVGPLEADQFYASLESELVAATTIQAEGESASAPVIDKFEGKSSGNMWMLRGHVTDDAMLITGRVYFGDALAGHDTAILSDGSFVYFVYMPPGSTGRVTAIAMDAFGNLSNTSETFIGP